MFSITVADIYEPNVRFAPQAVTPASGFFLTQVSDWLLVGRPESISLRNP